MAGQAADGADKGSISVEGVEEGSIIKPVRAGPGQNWFTKGAISTECYVAAGNYQRHVFSPLVCRVFTNNSKSNMNKLKEFYAY